MAFEQTRDMRSSAQDSKRAKDRNTKWSRGMRPSPGCNTDAAGNIVTGSESQRAKARPERRMLHHPEIPSHNIVKAKLANDLPLSRSRAKVNAMEELSDTAPLSRSLIDMLPSTSAWSSSSSVLDGGSRARRKLSVPADGGANVLYNFDRAETTPGRPLSLDIFVKRNPKDTERLVEREYEILDGNGDALKGRKARRNLRRGMQAADQPSLTDPETVEDDGFELV